MKVEELFQKLQTGEISDSEYIRHVREELKFIEPLVKIAEALEYEKAEELKQMIATLKSQIASYEAYALAINHINH